MAVFEYKGIEVASGKAVKGFRDADNQKALRTLLRRDGVLLTLATEDERKGGAKREIRLFAFLQRPSTADIDSQSTVARKASRSSRLGSLSSAMRMRLGIANGEG